MFYHYYYYLFSQNTNKQSTMNYVVLVIFLLPISVVAFSLITFDVDGTLVQGSGQAAAQSAHAKGKADGDRVCWYADWQCIVPLKNSIFLFIRIYEAFSLAVGRILGDGLPVTPVADALPVRKSC
jgi:hypothetical protein